MKKTFAVMTSAALLFASSAFASGFGPAPASMEDEATDYIEQRLENPNGSSVKAVSAPYKVTADLNGGDDENCWAIDMRIRTKLASGQTGRDTLTVLFYEGEPVALRSDLNTRVARVDDSVQFASR
jgi:hypothetical protein